jgi:16S rRNA C1402 (ribose-2'-O) methylase RsmI
VNKILELLMLRKPLQKQFCVMPLWFLVFGIFCCGCSNLQLSDKKQSIAVPGRESPFDNAKFIFDKEAVTGKLYVLVTARDMKELNEQVVVRCLEKLVSYLAQYHHLPPVVFYIRRSTESQEGVYTIFTFEEIVTLFRASKEDAATIIRKEHNWTLATIPDF